MSQRITIISDSDVPGRAQQQLVLSDRAETDITNGCFLVSEIAENDEVSEQWIYPLPHMLAAHVEFLPAEEPKAPAPWGTVYGS